MDITSIDPAPRATISLAISETVAPEVTTSSTMAIRSPWKSFFILNAPHIFSARSLGPRDFCTAVFLVRKQFRVSREIDQRSARVRAISTDGLNPRLLCVDLCRGTGTSRSGRRKFFGTEFASNVDRIFPMTRFYFSLKSRISLSIGNRYMKPLWQRVKGRLLIRHFPQITSLSGRGMQHILQAWLIHGRSDSQVVQRSNMRPLYASQRMLVPGRHANRKLSNQLFMALAAYLRLSKLRSGGGGLLSAIS